MAETAGIAVAAGASTIFGYNRHNFLYDRKMRQKQEIRITAFRNRQADLWREDVRDLIGLTIGKMETYTVVNALLIVLCIETFTAGRLVPGTPEWLLWLYTAHLSGAFAYLLQALWLAMHASVAAQAGSARLLTQLIRLPVPSWEQLESMRTYGSSVEGLGMRKLLRVPFVDTLFRRLRRGSWGGETAGAGPGPQRHEEAGAADPWDLERRGGGIYELQHKPPQELRHTQLVRRAAAEWQGQEAFTRVAMTLGVCQLLYAIAYYCLGQVLVEAGEAWGALFLCLVLAGAVASLLGLDLSLLAREAYTMCILVYAGPFLAGTAALCWCTYTPSATNLALGLLPFAFAAHGLLFTYVAALAGGQEQPNGAVIPVRWRAVLYVDVFGWLRRKPLHSDSSQRPALAKWTLHGRSKAGYSLLPEGTGEYAPEEESDVCIDHDSSDEEALEDDGERAGEAASDRLLRELRAEIGFWQSEEVSQALSTAGRDRVRRCAQEFDKLAGSCDGASPSLGSSASPAVAGGRGKEGAASASGQQQPVAGPVRLGARRDLAGDQDGRPLSLADTEARLERLRAEIAAACRGGGFSSRSPMWSGAERCGSSSSRMRDSARTRVKFKDPKDTLYEGVGSPSAVPRAHDRAFEGASYGPPGEDYEAPDEEARAASLREGQAAPWVAFRGLTRLLAGVHFAGALWSVWRFSGHPDLHVKPLPLADEEMFGSEGGGSNSLATELAEGGLQISPQYLEMPDVRLSKLVEGNPLETIWPHSKRFEPRALTCDSQAQHFVVADDFGVYAAQLARPPSAQGHSTAENRGQHLRARAPEAVFERAPPCWPLEGHAPKDVEILCTTGSRGERCSALVLYVSGQGMTLAECPLQREAERAAWSWDISVDWLDDLSDEAIESVALGRRCRGPANTSVEVAPGVGRCILVGTSKGRLVQLRRHVTKRNQLVPLWASRTLRSSSRQVAPGTTMALSRGSLHVVPAGYVMVLQPDGGGRRHEWPGGSPPRWPSIMAAFDMEQDRIMSEWELPEDVQWQSLCGGGEHALYMLGRRAGRGSSLWRFTLPPELRHRAPGHELLSTDSDVTLF